MWVPKPPKWVVRWVARHGDLRRVDLHERDLSDCNLQDAEMRRAILYRAHLPDADLRGATLSHADLRGANCDSIDLSDANLSSAVGSIHQVRLKKAELMPARFRLPNQRVLETYQTEEDLLAEIERMKTK